MNDGDILKNIFKMQKELAQVIVTQKYPGSKDDRISVLATAIIHEAVELQRLTNWKWWKRSVQFNTSLAKEELIDIWHFVVQASIELEMTPEDILEEYLKKNKINRERQRSGY
jgi:dimeric dUTPase (all-alpha-NTP-PPase superfamily)